MDEYTAEGLFQLLEDEGDDITHKINGFDDCIVGLGSVSGRNILIYDQEKIIDKLQDDMSYDDAIEYFSFNIDQAHLGDGTPVIMFIRVVPGD